MHGWTLPGVSVLLASRTHTRKVRTLAHLSTNIPHVRARKEVRTLEKSVSAPNPQVLIAPIMDVVTLDLNTIGLARMHYGEFCKELGQPSTRAKPGREEMRRMMASADKCMHFRHIRSQYRHILPRTLLRMETLFVRVARP